MQVKKGDVQNLPLKLFLDMSSHVQPLFREWRARLWSLSFGAAKASDAPCELPQQGSLTASQLEASGNVAQMSFDSDDDGRGDAQVSAEAAAAFARRAHDAQFMQTAATGAPVHLFTDPQGRGKVLHVGVHLPVQRVQPASSSQDSTGLMSAANIAKALVLDGQRRHAAAHSALVDSSAALNSNGSVKHEHIADLDTAEADTGDARQHTGQLAVAHADNNKDMSMGADSIDAEVLVDRSLLHESAHMSRQLQSRNGVVRRAQCALRRVTGGHWAGR